MYLAELPIQWASEIEQLLPHQWTPYLTFFKDVLERLEHPPTTTRESERSDNSEYHATSSR